jgi:glycosyltransferase involved in cell wall biosynthesis
MDEKIKVLFFISSLAGGGAERVMVDILTHIDRRMLEPVLVLLHPHESSPYRESLPREIRIIVIERRSNTVIGKIRQLIYFVKTVFRERPHVMLSMLTHNNIMALFAGILSGIRVIVCEHIMLGKATETGEGKRMLGIPVAPMVTILYRFADKVISVSEEIGENLIREFHVPARKIQIIYNPIDFDRVTELSKIRPGHPFFEEEVPVVIAAGRLVPQKGFDILIEAFRLVLSEMDARLIILGEGSEQESLNRLVKDRNITARVFFAGFQNNPYSFLSRADLFVLSSLYEGLPLVLLEAMACGTPVVSADCRSGPREILDNGRYGVLVPAGDTNALARGVLEMLRNRALRNNFSIVGKKRASDFSVGRIITQYEAAVHKAFTHG